MKTVSSNPIRITRLAPSPTGALHLGNARTFLINWLFARRFGWKILLRIEDLDGPRVKRGADQQAIDDLRWLGIDWDEQSPHQSSRTERYRAACDDLLRRGLAYPCTCTRKEVELAASAPHAEDGASIYPGSCRGRYASVEEARNASGREPAIRFRVPDETVSFNDALAGAVRCEVARELSDFVIFKNDGTAAYQLAVVLDDADSGVTDVVRGDDLLDSTPRQILLYRAFGMDRQIPNYTHLPLVVGMDGRRLAKRHGDTRLETYRQSGTPASRVLALLANWTGIRPEGDIRSAADLLNFFDPGAIPRGRIVFSSMDDTFLREGKT